ncbi:coiled-coil domain-containing protein 6 isoform X5 [Daphnia magna]|uniref:EOG090X09V8 n=1 Tax=Daphnia magna TaxID=35525 RepID=A0A4Y7MQP5_9CRUS|nr:coiled-coil domain-containing protein 6 isoform X5 [Daphnia magna]CAG4639361.1 EOG090X09V8 [Daphnia magna]SVE80852.1 EOG090X09V8 [Daphnia magna]SVE82613.1 EOG090X09V8 [Daphnia magna]SVE83198.1 EOG090X09V8 [Daphnia magna]
MESGRNSVNMADSASESDCSVDGGPIMMPPSPVSREQLHKRIESLQQQNKVLKVELDTYKLRVKQLQEENRALRQASVNIQARAEQEEEFISNTLLKKIQALKKEKETLALNYEQEEECLTNDLSRKLNQLRQEKVQLEQTLEQEQECLVNKLMRKIEKLEAETHVKQNNLEQLRREKVELENTLEQEQEALVNKLWKRMDKLETEKRNLQIKLDQPVSAPPSPRDTNNGDSAPTNSTPEQLTSHIQWLRNEVSRLKHQLTLSLQEQEEKMAHYAQEEKHIRDENLRLQRRLQMEMERREALCRHLSESESSHTTFSYSVHSLEMEEERHYNELTGYGHVGSLGVTVTPVNRSRTTSSPVPSNRPLSPRFVYWYSAFSYTDIAREICETSRPTTSRTFTYSCIASYFCFSSS